MINLIVSNINIIASIIAVVAFGGLIFQIYLYDKHIKEERSIYLVSRYYSDYFHLKKGPGILSRLTLKTKIADPLTGIDESLTEIMRNDLSKLIFYRELALYWKKNLINKDLIIEHLGAFIPVDYEDTKNILYPDKDDRPSFLYIIDEMFTDFENSKESKSIDEKLELLYEHMNITEQFKQ